MIGKTISHYKITEQLGVGGMGEVYLADDTTLDRKVALKFLPVAFTSDPERMARFEREAKLLASLNHPNIAGIYGLEQADGNRFLVLEYVEGKTLQARLSKGALPLEDALLLCRQIAEGLEAAHEKGVIHRDLKPANVMITAEEKVKILDFGLAKALLDETQGIDSSQSPTLTEAMTRPGVILGTAAYMSPEQAKGKSVDKRADVWALGTVLFEMLSGRRAFEGEDVSDTIAAVLRGEPDWSLLPSETPPAIVAVIRRCLKKDSRDRLNDVSAILWVIDEPTLGGLVSTGNKQAVHTGPNVLGMTVALVVGIGIGALWMWWANEPPPTRVSRLTVSQDPANPVLAGRNGNSMAIAPDGSRVAYVSRGGTLMVRELDELVPRVRSTGSIVAPFFSPDGQSIGFFIANTGLFSVRVAGGPVAQQSKSDAGSPGGAAWAPDGTLVFGTRNRSVGLYIRKPGGEEISPLTTPNRSAGEADHLWPSWLPNGRNVLFTIEPTDGDPDSAQVAVLDVETGDYHVVVPGGSFGRYIETGHLLYATSGGLRAIRFDPGTLRTTGNPVTVVPGVLPSSDAFSADFDVARDGTLIYVAGGDTTTTDERRLVWVGRDGSEEYLEASPDLFLYPRLSRAEDQVLLDIRDQDNDIWLFDLDRSTKRNLTQNPALDRFPLWSPDGERFAFVSNRAEEGSAIYLQRLDGTSEVERVGDFWPTQQTPNAFTSDGSQMLFDRDGDLFILDLDGSQRITPILESAALESRASLSPDDRWLAYISDATGRIEVYVRPFPNTTDFEEQVSVAGGVLPWWSRAGDELFYFSPEGDLMSVRVDPAAESWTSFRPTVVIDSRVYWFGPYGFAASTFDVSSDPDRFLMIQLDESGEAGIAEIIVVQNFSEELRRLLP